MQSINLFFFAQDKQRQATGGIAASGGHSRVDIWCPSGQETGAYRWTTELWSRKQAGLIKLDGQRPFLHLHDSKTRQCQGRQIKVDPAHGIGR